MKPKDLQDAQNKALRLCDLIRGLDTDYTALANPYFDLEAIDKDFSVEGLSDWEKDEYWKLVKMKKRFDERTGSLMKRVEAFIRQHRVSPILSFEDGMVTTGFEMRIRKFRVKGSRDCNLTNPEWFEKLEFPEPPKTLREVFRE